MEKNNTKCFESIYNLLSILFGDVQCTDSCKRSADCNCTCHCHNTDEQDEQDEQDEPVNSVNVLSFTDEDFKDVEKLNEYIDYLEDLREMFESNSDSIFSLVKIFGFDYNQIIDELIEHAESVYDESHEEPEEENPKTYTTQLLAENYVKDVLAPTFNGIVSEKTQQSLIDSYKKFADWILEHK